MKNHVGMEIFCFLLHLSGLFNMTSEFYLNSEMSSTLLRMKAVPRMAVFFKHDVTIGMSIFFR